MNEFGLARIPVASVPPVAAPKPRPALSVVVPCYNETGVLAELHDRVTKAAVAAVGDSYEFVLVDDGSSDDTWGAIASLSATDPHVLGIRLSRNYGQQLALSAGLRECSGELVFIIDADMQDPPELLPDMMKVIAEGADVVYGQRISRGEEPWLRKAGAKLFYTLIEYLSDRAIPPNVSDFRLMRRRVLDVLNEMPEQHRFVRGMISWIGFDQRPLPFHRGSRASGKTRYSVTRLTSLAVDAITSFSIRPLRLAIVMAMLSLPFAVIMAIYIIGSWVLGFSVAGWASVMTAVVVFGTAQLIILGIIGEYLGRLYMGAKNRPLYVVSEVKRRDG
ncbi:MAG TPA: glycosyltransferase family 2 protein [Dongiaceae bacterium]|jgi:dolichol-phosphate mannosyltransferase|nr:glycosyltransferase family 2 protein [Dongiaceae bacterium]